MIRGENIYLRALTVKDAEKLLKLYQDNRNFFQKNSPIKYEDEFYTTEMQLSRIKKFEEGKKQDQMFNFGIFKGETLIGLINLYQVTRGIFQRALIGYSIGEKYNGKGYATEATHLIINYAFNKLQLHRIMAEVMPENIGSIRVLKKVGFHEEGLSKSCIKVNDQWEDRLVFAIVNIKD